MGFLTRGEIFIGLNTISFPDMIIVSCKSNKFKLMVVLYGAKTYERYSVIKNENQIMKHVVFSFVLYETFPMKVEKERYINT